MMKNKRTKILPIIAIVLLVIALNPSNPYGYYVFLRWVCCAIFISLSNKAVKNGQNSWAWILGIAALLYNPVLVIHLTREIWTIINLIAIAIAGISIKKLNEKKSHKNIPKIPQNSVDPKGVYRYMRENEVDLYQTYLSDIFEAINIEDKGYNYQWTKEDGDKITEIAGRAKCKHNLHFLYFQTMLEQYIDADVIIRQFHKEHWVCTVTGFEKPIELISYENNFFPDALTIYDDVHKRFCE